MSTALKMKPAALIDYMRKLHEDSATEENDALLTNVETQCTQISDYASSFVDVPTTHMQTFRQMLLRALQIKSSDGTVLARHTHLFAILKCIARDREAIEMILTGDKEIPLIEAVCVRLRSQANASTIDEVAVHVQLLKMLNNACYLSANVRESFIKDAGLADCVIRLGEFAENASQIELTKPVKNRAEMREHRRTSVNVVAANEYDRVYFNVRLIFIVTALDAEQRAVYFQDSLLKPLFAALKHCTAFGRSDAFPSGEMAEMSIEILKTLFNLLLAPNGSGALLRERTVFEEVESMCLDNCIECCRHVLVTCAPMTPRMQHAGLKPTAQQTLAASLSGHACNLLTMMPPATLNDLTKTDNNTRNMAPIDAILSLTDYTLAANYCPTHKPAANGEPTCPAECVHRNGNVSQEAVATLLPLLCLLSQLAETECREHRKHIRRHILPKLYAKDAQNRPELGGTTRARLVRLLTCVNDRARDAAAELLYVICDKSVDKLIKFVGYGNASGLLAARGLMMGDRKGESSNEQTAHDSSDEDESYSRLKERINPVLGCIDDEEAIEAHRKWLQSLSDEQKEYEAHKLMQQINKLLDDGVIKPATIGEDGRPKEVEHVLELADRCAQQLHNKQAKKNE